MVSRCGFSPGLQRQTVVVDHDLEPVAIDDRTRLGEVQRHHGNVFGVDVGPDVDLGPVRQREHADAVAAAQPAVVEVPEFGALVLRVPAMLRIAEAEHALLGAGLLFVAARATDGGIAAVLVERLLERLGLHDVGVARAMRERRNARGLAGFVRVDDELGVEALGGLVAERDHFLELPARVDVQQREGNAAREEGLAGQVQQDRGVLADGIHEQRLGELGRHFAEDVDALGLEPGQVGQLWHRRARPGTGRPAGVTG